jgi:cobalt-zinc-cadmium efflux system membrane fusion protein
LTRFVFAQLALAAVLGVLLTGCNQRAKADPRIQEASSAEVIRASDSSLVIVANPERFRLATASLHSATPELNVTGVVSADISRNVPVISLASGRILEIHARLGDNVTKGQLLMRVQSSDLAAAFSDYRQAVADEGLASAQLKRSKILYEKGAIAQKDFEVVQEAEEKARVVVETTTDRLTVLGADKDHPSVVIDVSAPVSGVITDQQVTAASGTQGLASPNAFTIADLSRVWIVCDVYENDLPFVRIGEPAEVRINAYAGVVLKGRISNIGSILDPNIRTAKVRIEVQNPGLLRLGMFVRATFHSQRREVHTEVPASAIVHLHDRDWVYVPQTPTSFRRVEVHSGRMLPPDGQEVLSGIRPGDRVVAEALLLEGTSDQ